MWVTEFVFRVWTLNLQSRLNSLEGLNLPEMLHSIISGNVALVERDTPGSGGWRPWWPAPRTDPAFWKKSALLKGCIDFRRFQMPRIKRHEDNLNPSWKQRKQKTQECFLQLRASHRWAGEWRRLSPWPEIKSSMIVSLSVHGFMVILLEVFPMVICLPSLQIRILMMPMWSMGPALLSGARIRLVSRHFLNTTWPKQDKGGTSLR